MAEHEERSYIAFISYRHKDLDREAAVALQKRIEHFRIPKEYRNETNNGRLGYCFRDEDELPTSSSLSDSIRYALDHTQFLIVICTPDLPKSEWCAEEIRYFLSTHDRDHLLAVLVNGEPEESFSPYMTNIYDENGEVIRTVEPLAANITGTPEHYSRAKFKKESTRICAALLGCPFDELWQRERRYQNRRKAVFGGIAFAALAVFAIVVGTKNLQISAKNAEISEQNRQITAQNEEISSQNQELQVREGKLLTEAGQLLLEGYDLKGAADSARQALSIENVHTEGAKLLLADSLGAYNVEKIRLDLCTEQESAILRAAMLSDGSIAYTSDAYGVVRAFKEDSELWSFNAVPAAYRAEYLDSGYATDLYLVRDDSILLVGNAYYVAGISPQSGELIWELKKQNVVNFLAVSPDGTQFAVFNDFADPCVSIRSTGTGETLKWSYLPEYNFMYSGVELTYPYTFSDYTNGKSFGGCFSADGKYFLFGAQISLALYSDLLEGDMSYSSVSYDYEEALKSFLEDRQGKADSGLSPEEEAEKRGDIMVYCVMDTEEGSLKNAGIEPIQSGMNPIFGLSFDPEKEQLFFVRHDDLARATFAGTIDAEGKISYSLQMTDLRLNNSSVPRNYLEGTQTLVASSANNLYIFDKAAGTFTGRYELDRNVVACQWIDEEHDVLMAVQEDGVFNVYPLVSDQNYQYVTMYDSFPINNLQYAAASGGSIFTWNEEKYGLEGSAGRWLLVSADSPRKIMAADIFTDTNVEKLETEEDLKLSSYGYLSGDGKEFSVIFDQGGTLEQYLFDTADGSLVSRLEFDNVSYLPGYSFAIIPGGAGFCYSNKIYHADGSSEILETTESLDRILTAGSVRGQASDGTVYTACAFRLEDGDYVLYWNNAETAGMVSATEETSIILTKDEDKTVFHPKEDFLMAVGSNGYTVTGVCEGVKDRYNEYMIHTPDAELLDVHSLGGAQPWSLICTQKKGTAFAVLEDDGVIRFYDPAKDAVILEISRSDGFAGAFDMCFTDDDRYFGVLGSDGEFSLYDAATGSLLMKDTDGGLAAPYGDNEMQLKLTADGNRLICISSEVSWNDRSHGAVYNLSTYERVAEIPNIVAYSPVTDQVFLYKNSGGGRVFYRCPLYDTEELLRHS